MKPLSISLLLGLFAATRVSATLDFTVQHSGMVADAIPVDATYITDGSSKIFLRIPSVWKVFNTAQALDCLPNIPDSKIRLEPFRGAKPLTVDQAGVQELQRLAAAQLPPDSKEVVALPPELNPLPLFGWNTVEATYRYEYFGQAMRRSVMYVGMMPDRLVQMTVTAPDADFDKVHKQARQLLASWFEPSRDLPPDLQRKYASPEDMMK